MVSLGIRTFLELKTYIEEVYSDYIYECIMCQEVVIKVSPTLYFNIYAHPCHQST